MRRLVTLDNAENTNQDLIAANERRAQKRIDLLHAAEFRHHDEAAKFEELLIISKYCGSIKFFQSYVKNKFYELVYIPAASFDGKRRRPGGLEIVTKQEIVLIFIIHMFFDSADKFCFVGKFLLDCIKEPHQFTKASVFVIEIDRSNNGVVS